MSVRFELPAAVLIFSLAACGGSATGPTEAAPVATLTSCTPALTLDLQPGQTAPLDAGQAACFRLAAHAGARYALAGFDARSVDAARGAPEPAMGGDAVFAVGDGSGAAASKAPDLSRAPAPRASAGVRADVTPDATSPFSRATPWRVGERFPVRRVDTGETVTARVVRIMGGRYVFALVEADEEGHTGRFVSDTEKAMEVMVRDGLGVLNRTWGAREPVTSSGSGQVLVLYAAWNPDQGAGTATTYAAADGSAVGSYVWLNLNVRPGVREGFAMLDAPSYRLKVLAHELTHAWQMRYAYETQPAGPRSVSFGPTWALEGTADLVALEVVRRSLGITAGSNWGWQTRLQSPNDAIAYALQPADTRGRVSRGYYDAASFLQDVQLRMVRRGTSTDEALAQVARGALEGWYGVDGAGVRRSGLAERARAILGAGWEPADAVLLWTLAQAGDDQSDAAELNNSAYASVSDADNAYAWQPAVEEVRAGRSFAYQVTRAAGSSFYVRVRDDGPGGTVSLSANVSGTRWMIARIR
jgi:hypothetical protein